MYAGIILCMYFVNVYAHFYDTNITDLSKCKVHYSRTGSIYKDFYQIGNAHNQDDTLLLDFHFAVMAPSDAHILLAPSEDVASNEPVYEVVIGAGGNSFCDIRRKQKSEVKASVRIKGLLSALDPNSFWLHISKEGNIDVGKEGEELPFLSWIDTDPLPIKFISFSTWSGIEAKWYFDCERQNLTKSFERNLTHVEKLRKDLLYHYDPYVRPVMNISTVTVLNIAIQISHVSLNEHAAVIEVIGETKMAWHDEKLRWNPADYGDLEELHIFRREIWQPYLVLDNAVGDGKDILGDSMMIAHSNGLVEWNPPMHVTAWCNADTMGTWPSDAHKCSLMFGCFKDFEHIRMKFRRNESTLIYFESSEWSIPIVDIYSIPTSMNETYEPAVFQITLTLKRNSEIYNRIFFTPFLVVASSILITFWVDPMGNMKISLCCFQMILTTVTLLLLAHFAPNHGTKVPYLILLYSYSLVGELVATAISIIVINISRNTQIRPLPHVIRKILSMKLVKRMLHVVESEQTIKQSTSTVQRDQQNMWIIFGVAIDRISFLVYLIAILYAVCFY